MNDHELDELLARAAAVTDHDIARRTRHLPFDELCEEIMTTSTPMDRPQPSEPPAIATATRVAATARRRRGRSRLLLAAAAAIVAAVAIGAIVNSGLRTEPVWAAELVEFAESSPLMLIDDPSWNVVYADGYGNEGEMRFSDEVREADLFWRAGELSTWLDDRLNSGEERGTVDIAGATATIVQYTGAEDYTALWQDDGHVLEFRTTSSSVEEFSDLLGSLVTVDVDRWLSAMPASVIATAHQPEAIAGMLDGIPLPVGFDPDALAVDTDIKDRYQLGAQVVGQVSCAWIEQWLAANEAGDTVAARQALDAMDTSSGWPIVQEMNEEGAYGSVLQSYVDSMHAGGGASDDEPPLADQYINGLGCSH
jgi:hypothetical protein